MTPMADLNSPMTLLPQFNGDFTTEEQLSLVSRIAAASIGSQGTVGGLVIAGIVRTYPEIKCSSLANGNLLISAVQDDWLESSGRCWRGLFFSLRL
jgi:hypothetical protein